MSDIKIKFNGIELEEIESDKALCMGCNRNVELSDAEFCQWGDVHCYVCHRCLKILTKAQKEGRTVTKQELMEAV